jgi:enoyl-CoA hydratase
VAEDVVIVDREGAVATITLNRPEKRNAISTALMEQLTAAILELDVDAEVRAIILTGADPAFCAGVDLEDFSRVLDQAILAPSDITPPVLGMLPPHDTPIIGAINGPVATGGLEIAMDCDFLIASERARFADTHTRVGVLPGGGMTVRLPHLVGIDRARRMSLTGDFIDAETALTWGLVTEVTPHGRLLDRAREIAGSIVSIDPAATSAMRRVYAEVEACAGEAAYHAEVAGHERWMASHFDPASLSERRAGIIERGSKQA